MRYPGRVLTSAAVAVALVSSSVAGAATATRATAPQAHNPWAALTMMTPVSAGTIGSAGAVAAAQPQDAPPPQQGMGWPPLPVLAIWIATIAVMIYIATRDDDDDRRSNSPA